MHQRNHRSYSHKIQKHDIEKEKFEKIASKFLINLPEQQKSDPLRLPYHYQKAYYFYIDEVQKISFNEQKSINRQDFFNKLNEAVGPPLNKRIKTQQIIKILQRNRPTCGAIIVNQKNDKVFVIQTFGKLGFPKGGLNQKETEESCATREVKEEVGLFIHNKINPNDKIEFMNRGVKITYFIVKNFNENERIKIDTNEIDDAYWMQISEISKNIHRLTEKSRIVWKQFQTKWVIPPKLTMENFLNTYKPKKEKCKTKEIEDNPLLNFKFDKQRLFAVFNKN